MKAIQAVRAGGPDVLELAELPDPMPGPGQIRIRHSAIGVNFIDTYLRSGLYPTTYPAILGQEAAGVVDVVGEGVTAFRVGDAAAYALASGAYAELRCIPAARAVKLPDGISADVAAASLLKGMTAEFLLRRCYPVRPGQTILVHAAAGGVGTILTQWAARLGAEVIGVVGSDAKAELARGLGCAHVINASKEDIAARVREITAGAGVPVVYDSVGKDTFEASLGALARRGVFVSYGNASGPAPAPEPLALMRRGSLYFTRPTLGDYVATPDELRDSSTTLFDAILSGAIRIEIGRRFRLEDARSAHEALEARATVGASLLTP